MTKGGTTMGFVWCAVYVLLYLAIIILVIYMNGAVRKISIQYTSNVGGTTRGKSMNHLPLMINSHQLFQEFCRSNYASTSYCYELD